MDEALRSLGRQGDDPEIQARMLRMRIRSKDITPYEVKVASFLGHPGAQWLYPNALPKGITFKKLAREDPRLSLLLGWGALRPLLQLWEDDPRTQQLRGRRPAFADFERNNHTYQALLPDIGAITLHGWPRFILDLIEESFVGESLSEQEFRDLRNFTFNVQHGRRNMDRYYYSMRPIEGYINALHDLLQSSSYDGSTGWLKGIWTTKYNQNYGSGKEYPHYLVARAEAVYAATKVLADSEIIANNIRIPRSYSDTPGELLVFNDSGGVRSITQPKQPKPYVKFKYWQGRHKELAAPYIMRYLL